MFITISQVKRIRPKERVSHLPKLNTTNKRLIKKSYSSIADAENQESPQPLMPKEHQLKIDTNSAYTFKKEKKAYL